MDAFTRSQLLELCAIFYRAQAEAFDASRGHHAWPGWSRLVELMNDVDPEIGNRRLRVLDVGCGNARLARFLAEASFELDYIGVDSNATLLESARERLPAALRDRCRLVQQDFLVSQSAAHSESGRVSDTPGAQLPKGPFDLVALMGVLHHVPGGDWRLALLSAAAERLAPGGVLALAAWQFAGRARFEKRRVAWSSQGSVLGRPIDEARLEAGDQLLRFGDDPSAPARYCHQVADVEFDAWPEALGLGVLGEFRADGGEGDLNRYLVLRRAPDPVARD